MNIDEYRALKAQQAEQANSKAEEQPNVQAEQGTVKPDEQANQTQEQTNQTQVDGGAEGANQEPTNETKPSAFEIDGKQVTLEEIKEWQNGYLRQSDYTKKTQDLAQQKREAEQALALFNQVKENPEIAEQLGFNPQQSEYQQLQQNYHDLLLQQEVDSLSKKYDDFNVVEVLTIARDKQLELEDAYLLNKASKPKSQESAPVTQEQPQTALNADELKAQLRAELLAELEAERNTQTIISSNANTAPVGDNEPKLSSGERKVARMMRLSDSEYATWRDTKKKKK